MVVYFDAIISITFVFLFFHVNPRLLSKIRHCKCSLQNFYKDSVMRFMTFGFSSIEPVWAPKQWVKYFGFWGFGR